MIALVIRMSITVAGRGPSLGIRVDECIGAERGHQSCFLPFDYPTSSLEATCNHDISAKNGLFAK